MAVTIKMVRDKETKNYVKFKIEENEHIEDFQKGIYIKKESELAGAKSIILTLEIEEQ